MKVLFVMSLCVATITCTAQNADEWGDQEKTQKKYLVEQITALHVFLEFAHLGYKIADFGLTTVKKIKTGDFNLHDDFFKSLLAVKPNLKAVVDIPAIISFHGHLMRNKYAALKLARDYGVFTVEDISYCERMFDKTIEEFQVLIDALATTMTSGQEQVNDAGRVKRLKELCTQIQNVYVASLSITSEIKSLAVQKVVEGYEINRSKLINGVK